MDAGAILQRTDIGRDTIKTKCVRLTQSERLVLILVDGVTPFAALREKVWALSEERFTKALDTLLQKDLIYEVLLPLEDQQAEEIDSAVVERFLQQDAHDPVTIIKADPEDELDTNFIEAMGYSAPPTSALASQEETPLQAPDLSTTSVIQSPASLPENSSALNPIPEATVEQDSHRSQQSHMEQQYKKDLEQYVIDETAAITLMVNAKKASNADAVKKESFPRIEQTENRIYWTNHFAEGFALLSLTVGIIILFFITAHYLF